MSWYNLRAHVGYLVLFFLFCAPFECCAPFEHLRGSVIPAFCVSSSVALVVIVDCAISFFFFILLFLLFGVGIDSALIRSVPSTEMSTTIVPPV